MAATEGDALARLGWDPGWAAAAQAVGAGAAGRQPARPGRVARVDRGWATVLVADGGAGGGPGADPHATRARLAGHEVVTGDWVVLRGDAVAGVLARRGSFVRGDAGDGRTRRPQVVAANVDVVFVVQALTNGPNLRRLERELVLAFESGAEPVVVLSKRDLVAAGAVALAVDAARTAAPGVEVVATSVVDGAGLDRLRALAAPGRTVALIGASGVGKSRLVNALAGGAVQAVGDVRAADQRGRHTTTARELVALPGGGWLLDTPGLRSVALWEAHGGLLRVFADVEALAAGCRFANCTHTAEPACAVREAVGGGRLDPARLDHYRRLEQELDAARRRR